MIALTGLPDLILKHYTIHKSYFTAISKEAPVSTHFFSMKVSECTMETPIYKQLTVIVVGQISIASLKY